MVRKKSRKKLMALILSILMLGASAALSGNLAAIATQNDPTVYLNGPDEVTYEPGEKATYTLSMENMPNLNIVNFTMSYDSDYFAFDSISLPSGFMSMGAAVWNNVGGSIMEASVEYMRIGGPNYNGGDFLVLNLLLLDVQDGSTTTVEFSDFTIVSSGSIDYVFPVLETTVTTKFLSQSIVLSPALYLTGPDEVANQAGAKATYTLSAENMPEINVLNFTIIFDAYYFTPDSFKAGNGIAIMNTTTTPSGVGLRWVQVSGSIWEARVEMVKAGTSNFSNGDLFEITFSLKNVPDGSFTTVEFKDFVVVAANSGGYVSPVLDTTVTTLFTKWYSRYDLNKDGFVDWLDTSLILDNFMIDDSYAIWPSVEYYDVFPDGILDLEDLVLVRHNFT